MLEFVTERHSVWERLKQTDKPIVLYGMGNGAEKILRILERSGIPVAGIFASDSFVRGQIFRGFQVERYTELAARLKDFIILLAFGTAEEEVLRYFRDLDARHELYAPDLPIVGTDCFDEAYLLYHSEKIQFVYNLLEDEASKRCFAALLNYKISGKLTYLWEATTPRGETFETLLRLGPEETFVDLGAYRGDTLAEFLHYTGGRYRHMIALEPDAKNFSKLSAYAGRFPHTQLYRMAAWKEDTQLTFACQGGRQSALSESGVIVPAGAVDTILEGRPATYLKIDVEGAEKEAIEGCEQTIRRWRPKLMVSVYHRNEDLFSIALQLWRIQPHYRFYLRHYPGVPAWDTVLICLPKEEP